MCAGLRNRANPLWGSCFGCKVLFATPGARSYTITAANNAGLCCCSKQTRYCTMIGCSGVRGRGSFLRFACKRKVTQRSSVPGSPLGVAFFHNDEFMRTTAAFQSRRIFTQ